MVLDNCKQLFCTWKGIDKVKRLVSLGAGAAVLVTAVLTILNIFNAFDLVNFIRQVWNCLFAVLMILLQLNWTAWIKSRFGFLTGWFGRGMFYLLCAPAKSPACCAPCRTPHASRPCARARLAPAAASAPTS